MGSVSSARWRTVIAATAAFAALSCSTTDDSSPAPTTAAEPSASAARTVDSEPLITGASVLHDPSLNPEGVINAAVLLHSGGDTNAALAQGSFTRADLAAARAALADGSLDYLFE